jgi:hypothetical protein
MVKSISQDYGREIPVHIEKSLVYMQEFSDNTYWIQSNEYNNPFEEEFRQDNAWVKKKAAR